jgi:hypothetical protein
VEKEDIKFWKTIGIQANNKSTEGLCLSGFLEKYLEPYSEILSLNKNLFYINFDLCKNPAEKKQYILDWFIKSRIQNLNLLEIYETPERDWDKFSDRIRNITNKIIGLIPLFKKYYSKIKFVGESINESEKSISWLYKIQNKIVKKEIVQINENKFLDETTYLILTFRPNRILVSVSFGDINRRIEGKIRKPLSKIINYPLEIGLTKEEGDLNKILGKIVTNGSIKGIKFLSSKLTQTPHLEIISRKNYKNICPALKELSDKSISSTNLEDVDFFMLNVDKRNITIKLHHRKIAGYRKSVVFEYNEARLNDKELKEIKDLGINNNCLYLDNSQIDKKKDLNNLLNRSHQLNYYEQLTFEETINKLLKEGLLKKEDSEPPTVSYSIQYERVYDKLLEAISVLRAKRANVKNILDKKSSIINLISIESNGENSLIVLFFREPSDSTIKRIEKRWLDGEVPTPLFISLKEEFIQKLTNKEISHINLTEIIYSLIFDKNLLSVLSSKLESIKENYRLKYERDLTETIREVEDILKDTSGTERNKEFERAIYVIMKGLFRDVVKMGGPNVPDGGLRFGIQNRALWDAKLWIKSEFCNNNEEIKKIKTYCRASKREKFIQEFGGLKEYYLIGKIRDYANLQDKVFSPLKKELKKKYGLKVSFRYLDIEGTLLKLIKIRNSIPDDKLKDYNFYEELIKGIGETSIILDLPLQLFLKSQDKERVQTIRKEVAELKKK